MSEAYNCFINLFNNIENKKKLFFIFAVKHLTVRILSELQKKNCFPFKN
jgi:hypothetical protein